MLLLLLVLIVATAAVVTSQQPFTYGVYDEAFAEKMLNMAAAAHASDSTMISQCLNTTFPSRRWNLWSQRTIPCDSKDNLCQGFVAISYDDMKILISYRGTECFSQIMEEVKSGLSAMVYYNNVIGQGSVIRYFYDAVNRIYGPLGIESLISMYPNFEIWVTGHSLGGALATLTALKINIDKSVAGDQIKLVTFGEPRIGDYHFAQTLRLFLPNMIRVVHGSDPIPHGPPCGNANDFCTNTCPQIDGEPFHAPQEIWYSSLTKEMPIGDYRICNGSLHGGEDPACSNSVDCLRRLRDGAHMHLNYFNHFIPKYGKAGCVDFAASHSISAFVAITSVFVLCGLV